MGNKIKHTGFNINKVGSSPSPFSFVSLSFPSFYFSSWMIMSYNCWLKHRCRHLHCVWGGEWVWLMCLKRVLGPDSCKEGGLWGIDQHGMSEQERMIMMFRCEWKGGYQPSRKLDSKCSPSDEHQSLRKVGRVYTCERWPKMKCGPVWAKKDVLTLGHVSLTRSAGTQVGWYWTHQWESLKITKHGKQRRKLIIKCCGHGLGNIGYLPSLRRKENALVEEKNKWLNTVLIFRKE